MTDKNNELIWLQGSDNGRVARGVLDHKPMPKGAIKYYHGDKKDYDSGEDGILRRVCTHCCRV